MSRLNRVLIVMALSGAISTTLGCRQPQAGYLGVNLVDEFALSEPSGSWEFTTPQRWRIAAEGDRRFLYLSEPPASAPQAGSASQTLEQAVHKPFRFRNFSISCWVRLDLAESGLSRDACILFGRQDDNSFYCFRLSPVQRDLQAILVRVEGRREVALTPGGRPVHTPVSAQGWHRIDILRDVGAGTIEILVDRTRPALIQIRDTTYEFGSLGLASTTGGVGFGQVLISGEGRQSK